MKPVSPSAQDTVTSWPSGIFCSASPVPTTAGTPSSRAMIAAWQVRPPRLVTMAAARFMIGSQSVGHVGDQHVAFLEFAHPVERTDHAGGAGADLLADRAA